jgi:hypothetical protein
VCKNAHSKFICNNAKLKAKNIISKAEWVKNNCGIVTQQITLGQGTGINNYTEMHRLTLLKQAY